MVGEQYLLKKIHFCSEVTIPRGSWKGLEGLVGLAILVVVGFFFLILRKEHLCSDAPTEALMFLNNSLEKSSARSPEMLQK